jgi:hypothetical protein
MDEASVHDLRKELAALQVEERRLSAERDRLHHQIDFGFESETTRERELTVSAARRELHERIESVQKMLSARHAD